MARTAKNTNAIATVEEKNAALTTGFGTLNKISTNLAKEMDGLDAVFDRIRMPIGGIVSFELPTDDPDVTETVKEIEAVILYHHPMRAYYKEPYTGGNNPPDCGSLDGVVGKGEPGGMCDRCAFNMFGSAENGGKACKERHRLFLLQEGDVFPKILSLPTGSLKEFSRYLMTCIPVWQASNAGITRISLTKAVNKGGIVYSKAQFRMGRTLTEKEFAAIKPLIEQVKVISQEVIIAEPMDDDPATFAPSEMPSSAETAATKGAA